MSNKEDNQLIEKQEETEQTPVASEETKSVLSKTEHFFESNQQLAAIIMGAIVLVIGGYFAFKKLYVEPQEVKARDAMFVAEKYFTNDSLDLAINGDGNYDGLLDVIDEFSITKTAGIGKYYLGISYLKKGEYETAIQYLEDVDTDNEMLSSIIKGAIGDAYLELGEKEKAAEYYVDAASDFENKFSTPLFLMKAAFTFEEINSNETAVELYEKIKNDYPESSQSRDIDKYIARAKYKDSGANKM